MKRTPKQIAEAEGISQSTVYALVKQGRLEAYRIGARGRGRILIDDSAWLAFVATCKSAGIAAEDDGELIFLKR